jgi:thiamine transport system permease protein
MRGDVVGRVARGVALAVPLLFLGVLFALPLVAVVTTGLRPNGQWDFAGAWAILREPGLAHVVWFTLWQALASTALTLAIGLPGAVALSRFRFPGRRFVSGAIVVPFVLPTVVVGVAFLQLIGPNGLLRVNLDGTVWAILIAHVFFNYAVVVRTVSTLLAQIDPRLEEAARVLGASRWSAFRSTTWPLVRGSVVAASLIVFLFTFTSFGIIQIIGGNHATLDVEIYRQTAQLLDLEAAAVLSLLQIVAITAVVIVLNRSQRRIAVLQDLRPGHEVARRPRGWRDRTFLGANLTLMAVLLETPLVVLILRSFSTPSGYALTYWRALFHDTGSTLYVSPLVAVETSLEYACVAAFVAAVVGGCAAVVLARRTSRLMTRSLDNVLLLPLGVSAVTIGFGLLIALSQPWTGWLGGLRDSWLIVPLAQALVAIPFVVRTLVPVMRARDGRLRDAAAVLGASPLRAWTASSLPVLVPAWASAIGFAFAISLGEFGATVFLARPDAPTMPVDINRLVGHPGDLQLGQATAMSVVMLLVTLVVVLVIDRAQPVSVGAL